MAADIDIVNAALSKLGEQPLLLLTDNSPPGLLANRTYADIRDAFLREYPWNFATLRDSLAAEVAAPVWGFGRAFNMPSDLLRLIEVNNPGDAEWRNEGNQIVTDLPAPLQIRYIARVPEGQMDPTFRDALSARLAMEWAEALTQTTSVVDAMASLYQLKLNVARNADGQEDRQLHIDAPDFIDARF